MLIFLFSFFVETGKKEYFSRKIHRHCSYYQPQSFFVSFGFKEKIELSSVEKREFYSQFISKITNIPWKQVTIYIHA